ncbi:PIN domain-containing protein [Klenkia sp. LSe6-5]|uniref:PIN domain-containing protein n=1 Tax=Klenkia sesuvii TaxID=3103137 RepID=A0ABU8DV26_9ACTN
MDARVQAWARGQVAHNLFISAITVLGVEIGVERVARRDPDRGAVLRRWLEDGLLPAFGGRVLPVDVPVVRRAASMRVPDPRPERDALIAATAAVADFVVVTRNTADFAPLGVPLLDPWAAGS